ncbi:ferredoxin [Desulfobulbus sp.]|uniref:ferredoxin n=1 Tax=Desulfobulbus sp. TaxID=895 RepID=UPI0027B886AF|nr:ferredoxin [Desulfobulbus sp.]
MPGADPLTSGVSIDSYRCNGCATCCELCPDVFLLNPLTGKAELINPDQAVTEAVRQAAAFCPEKCIVLADESPADP